MFKYAKEITSLLNWCTINYFPYFMPTYDIYETLMSTACLLGAILSLFILIDRSFCPYFYSFVFGTLFFFHIHLTKAAQGLANEGDYLLNEIGFILPFIPIAIGYSNKNGQKK